MKIVLLTFTLFLYGCGSVNLHSYENTQPAFSLIQFFQGKTRAFGIVQDYSGEVTRRFTVTMTGELDADGTLVLDEHFLYDDGQKQFRQWIIKQSEQGYLGRASDIVGIAKGEERGFAVRWQYEMDLTVDGDVYRVAFDDWMYRLDQNRAFNKAKIKKWGITVAEVTLFFEKTL